MKKIQVFLKEYYQLEGVRTSIIITIISIIMFITSIFAQRFDNEMIFNINFLCLIIEFLFGIIVSLQILKRRLNNVHLIPFLFLNWFIGCFCTNLFMNVFENLPIWVYIVTFTFCLTNFFIYKNLNYKKLDYFFYFLNGITFLQIIYFMIYLIPLLPLSIIGIIVLGLGFYGLVPLIVFISHLITLYRKSIYKKKLISLFLLGVLTTNVGCSVFIVKLNLENTKLTSETTTKTFDQNNDLPNYIQVSQNLNPNLYNEILLKRGIVYVYTENLFDSNFGSFRSNQYNERKTHNPIINIAYFFIPENNLTLADRINILKSNFNNRHQTEEQLWSGEDLFTKNIKEDIRIYSNERLAYTEITIDVACQKKNWRNNEAIYSFQLPEGSVATSLSLWVNGLERKGVLTTKEKAQESYKQIVGVESRDPSLMQWKEGNRVVVRVFPVNKDLPRTFKCGFTTPLKVDNELMKYQSLVITGPNLSDAETLSRIQVEENKKLSTSKEFVLEKGFLINKSKGLDKWEATLPINNDVFSSSFTWKNKTYEIIKPQFETISLNKGEIILDLNTNWNEKEIEEFLVNTNRRYFVVHKNKKTLLTKENYLAIFSDFKNLQYSLLPLYSFKNTLVITKSGSFSANFEELESSEYLSKIKSNTSLQHIKVINISDEINPFWQTLKEQKIVTFVNLDLKNTIKAINVSYFKGIKNEENTVNIETANIAIRETVKTDPLITKKSSNHIYRMYAFGKVLEEQIKIQSNKDIINKYISLAEDANIVTPISSLLVLETEADYERFNIQKNINSLGNATIENVPGSPIPNQWILFLIGVIFAFFYFGKNSFNPFQKIKKHFH